MCGIYVGDQLLLLQDGKNNENTNYACKLQTAILVHVHVTIKINSVKALHLASSCACMTCAACTL